MAIISIRQPNNLLMLFSTVSCGPMQINLTKEEFIREYVKCFEGCTYRTSEQILDDAIDTVENHVNPWDRFLEDYIPCYARSEEDIANQLEEWVKKCSTEDVKEIVND